MIPANYSTISFPSLGIEVNPGRALALGPLTIHYYGLIIAIGLMLAVVYACRRCSQFGIKQDDLLDGVLWVTPFAILCARAYYCIFSWADYAENPISVLYIWNGGLAIYGGVLGAVAGILLLCRIKKIKIGALLDMVALGFLIGQSIGRWGNFMNREAFGAETTLPWRMQLTTVTGQLVEVHPTFLYESLWNLAGLLLIIFVVSKARRFDGENTWFYFLWYGIGRFWIEGLRTDSLYLFNWTIGGQPIRVSQALSLVMVFVSLFMLYYNIKLHPHKPEELYVNIVAARNAAAAEAAVAPAAESPAQATPTEDAPAVSSEPEAPSQKDTSGETPTEDPS
mgnify:CR=1 FL=1